MPLRIIYVTTSFPYSYGRESFFFPELIELKRQGHKVLVVPRSLIGFVEAEHEEFRANNVAAKGLFSYHVLRDALLEFIRNPARVLRLFLLVHKSRRVETVLKNILVFPKGLWLGRLSLRWGANHIHAQWATTTATMALIASEVSNIPWSFTAHRGDLIEDNLLPLKVWSASFIRLISISGIRLAERIALQELEEKARVIHMGVSIPNVKKRPHTNNISSKLLCPANFLPVKGHKYLLSAIALLKKRGISCSLQLAGEGRLRKILQQQVAELAISEEVSFLGHIPHADLMKFYSDQKIGIVVLPSVDLGGQEHEGIPVCLIEAMSYGIPVIATTTGGIPELLSEGAGILIPPGNSSAIADAVETLIKDHEKWWQLGEAGRRRVIDQFAVDGIVKELVANISTVTFSSSKTNQETGVQ